MMSGGFDCGCEGNVSVKIFVGELLLLWIEYECLGVIMKVLLVVSMYFILEMVVMMLFWVMKSICLIVDLVVRFFVFVVSSVIELWSLLVLSMVFVNVLVVEGLGWICLRIFMSGWDVEVVD